ncbi:MAG: DUF1592 domain-containing protein [Phycisphaeraceae bacterium]|nr:DUF1592 domain-containing protein [Phycisphaeraceae bacterium]
MTFSMMLHRSISRSVFALTVVVFGLVCAVDPGLNSAEQAARTDADSGLSNRLFQSFDRYCVDCHNPLEPRGGLDLESILADGVAEHPGVWEKVWRKLNTRQMPPSNRRLRPDEAAYNEIIDELAAALDEAASERVNPGRTDTFRHLTRTEYQNAIRDLLSLQVDATKLLPPTESSHGFDHITVGSLSPALLTRYISAAQRISKLAIGSSVTEPDGATYRVPPDVTQERHVEGLPLGTRGGLLVEHHFPRAGEYEIQVRLTRDRNDEVEGLKGTHEMEVLLNRQHAAGFTIAKPKVKVANHFDDTKLRVRLHVEAGPQDVGVTFVDKGSPVGETRREPLNVAFNLHRHPRLSPAVYQVSITGPYLEGKEGGADGDVAADERVDTPSRERIFGTYPAGPEHEEAAAHKILSRLARLAYRRPVDETDIDPLMSFYKEHAGQRGFESGIEAALSMILTNPHFLMKIERDPVDAKPGQPYQLNDYELASRLSFFLWSSIPDEELLNAAERGDLRKPGLLAAQVMRMLVDDKAQTLATSFASQWLHLRNLDAITPDARLYPDFDENLRRAMKRETELFFMDVVRGDRSVMGLLKADHTFLNERLAKHYGIPHVYGSRFRRVDLPTGSERGGLLRHGSVLTVTSYATRTSPVIRGNWVLENIVGTPTPPPPDDVPSLDAVIEAGLSVRERLARHREDPSCASCHRLMDPIGFSLEQFDAIGRWREREGGEPVDAVGGLPDGQRFHGVAGLETGLLKRPDLFVDTLTEKLLTYAIARGITYMDRPAIRQIVRDAKGDDYRFSAIVLRIVRSDPFQKRYAP